MRATRFFALVWLAAICSCDQQREAPVAPADALSGAGTIRRGVGPECPDTWRVETEAGEQLWPVTDPALQVDGLPVRFEAQRNEGAMSFCMAGTNVEFTRLERAGEQEPAAAP